METRKKILPPKAKCSKLFAKKKQQCKCNACEKKSK